MNVNQVGNLTFIVCKFGFTVIYVFWEKVMKILQVLFRVCFVVAFLLCVTLYLEELFNDLFVGTPNYGIGNAFGGYGSFRSPSMLDTFQNYLGDLVSMVCLPLLAFIPVDIFISSKVK